MNRQRYLAIDEMHGSREGICDFKFRAMQRRLIGNEDRVMHGAFDPVSSQVRPETVSITMHKNGKEMINGI